MEEVIDITGILKAYNCDGYLKVRSIILEINGDLK